MSAATILVTGATGQQGSSVIKALQASSTSFEIIALTRNAASPSAEKLKNQGVRILQGDQNDPEAIFSQAGHVDGVFSIQTPMGKGQSVESEERQGKALFDAAQKAGVKYFVYSSVERNGFDRTPVPHFASKHEVEKHIMEEAKTMQWTILRPVAFMDNIVKGFQTRVFFTALEVYTGAEHPMPWIAVDDIGRAAAMVFEKPDEYNKKAITLAGDSLALPQVQKIYGDVTKLNSKCTFQFLARFLFGYMMPELSVMMIWFKEVGYKADVEECRRTVPGLMNFETWAHKYLA